MTTSGIPLLQQAAVRILAIWLEQQGRVDVVRTSGRESLGGRAVDITYAWQGSRRRVKVKADPYFGVDPVKVNDFDLTFYRADQASFAFEAVKNAATREPGWMFESDADEIYYYFIAVSQSEDEVLALLGEPNDAVFLSELQVERDELVVLPMRETRAWFERVYEAYTPRPVMMGGASAWYRLVPRADIERAVSELRTVGGIFRTVSR